MNKPEGTFRGVSLLYVHVGTVMLNPNTQDSPSIMIRYKEYSEKPIVFPKLEAILEVASREMDAVSLMLLYILYPLYSAVVCNMCDV